MSSVTFSTTVGGDGSTVSDDSNPSTGLANGGHRTRFVPALSQMVAIAGNTVTKATEAAASATAAAASAASAVNAPGTQATSSTSLAVGTGSKSLTLDQTGKNFVVGQYVQVVSTLSPANYMVGAVTAFNASTGAMTISVTNSANVGGSGTYGTWAVVPSSPLPPNGMSLLATLTPTNGQTQVQATGLQSCRQFVVVSVEVTESGVNGLSVVASSNNGSTYSSGFTFTNSGTCNGVSNIYAADTSGKKLFTQASSTTIQAQEVPGSAAVNAIRVSTQGGSSFTGSGAIYIYGIN